MLQPLSSSVFFERGRTRRPRTPPLAYALQQCLELCWSLCNLTASHRWLHAGNVHHLASTASSWAASTPAADREAVLHACVSRVLCGTAVTCVFVCKYFLKPVATHASPHSSWTWSTTARPEAAHIEPTGSASGRTVPTKTFRSSTPSTQPWRVLHLTRNLCRRRRPLYVALEGASGAAALPWTAP